MASPTGLTVTVGRTTKKANVKLKRGRKATDWEEGWHFVRVYATRRGRRPHARRRLGTTRRTDESDRFLVAAPEGEFDEPRAPRAQHAPSVAQAVNRLRFTARADGRDPALTRLRHLGEYRSQDPIAARFFLGSAHPSSSTCRIGWRAVTEAPRHPHTLIGPVVEIDAADGVHISAEGTLAASLVSAPSFTAYLDARADLFTMLTGEGTGADVLVVE